MLLTIGAIIAVYIIYLIIKWSFKIAFVVILIIVGLGIFTDFKAKIQNYHLFKPQTTNSEIKKT